MSDKYEIPTQALTPKQMRERANALTEQAKRLQEQSNQLEIGPAIPDPNRKSSSSKIIINASFIIFGICGIIGSFWDAFDMSKYVEFLQVFAWVWSPLVLAVGGGMAVKNFVNKKYGESK